MAKAPNLFPLKLLVVSLGFILAGGMVFVLTTLVNKANKMNAAPCNDVTVSLASLPTTGMLTAVTPQGNHVQLTVSAPPKTSVFTLDRCTGTLLQQFTITP